MTQLATTINPLTPTKVTRGYYDKQLSACTYYQLDNGMQLKVTTFKSLRGVLYTSAQAMTVQGDTETFVICGDFSKKIKSYPTVKRVTDKSIIECHNIGLDGIEAVIDEANKFYTKE